MWSYIIDRINPSAFDITIVYQVFKDKKLFKEDYLVVSYSTLRDLPSDGRGEHIQKQVAEACKKYMVIQDTKDDFSSLLGVEVPLEPLTYETKAVREAKIADELAARIEETTVVDGKVL